MIPYYRPYYGWSEFFAPLCLGNKRSDFESALAARVGARYGIAFAYARSGVIEPRKPLELTQCEVILLTYTCEVMPKVAAASGNCSAFVHIKLDDYNIQKITAMTLTWPPTQT